MSGILLGLCVIAARFVAYPYLRGFFGAAREDARLLAVHLRLLWHTRSIRWRIFGARPDSTEPWTEAQCATLASALYEACVCKGCDQLRVDCTCADHDKDPR